MDRIVLDPCYLKAIPDFDYGSGSLYMLGMVGCT
jgi:hypothetical protein